MSVYIVGNIEMSRNENSAVDDFRLFFFTFLLFHGFVIATVTPAYHIVADIPSQWRTQGRRRG